MILILPSEQVRLSKRRASDINKGEVILHALDSDVFAYCCQYTDWKTGDIGMQSALSYARIALALSEEIPRKPLRHLRTVSAKQVENSVNRLVKADLFARRSLSRPQKNRLQLSRLLWCDLLMAHDCRKNTDGRQLLTMLGDLLGNKASHTSHLQSNDESRWEQNSNADGTYLCNYLSNSENRPFRLFLTWQPDREFVDLFLQASGFTGKQVKKIWFGSYVQYWSGEEKCRTQSEWSAHFAKHMQGYLLAPLLCRCVEKTNVII